MHHFDLVVVVVVVMVDVRTRGQLLFLGDVERDAARGRSGGYLERDIEIHGQYGGGLRRILAGGCKRYTTCSPAHLTLPIPE